MPALAACVDYNRSRRHLLPHCGDAACGSAVDCKALSGEERQCYRYNQQRPQGGDRRWRVAAVGYGAAECVPALGMRRQRQLRPVPRAGAPRRWPDSAHRNRALLPQGDKGRLASGMPGEGERRHGHRSAGIGTRCQGMGVRSNFQPQCGHVHQGVHRGATPRRAYGFHTRFLCADKDSSFRDGLCQGHRPQPHRR